ncbi:MAG: cellulase family glycosylhydrolase [Anaerolineales bacterium]
MFIIRNNHFIDSEGRTVHLRGVNLGGSSKVPSQPNGATWNKTNFYDHRHVSFVGRPFPLAEADEHFTRLKTWGLTFLRLLITWEAIEHAGPGQYDEAYLDYIYAIVKKAAEYEMYLFIDPHQDVWSRFTGGDGAPGWIFDLLGMDITKFHASGAAFIHQEHGDPFPRMLWPSNYGKYVCATMFTLFYGGNTFAPHITIEGLPAQDFLQTHYIESVKQVAARVQEFPHILGYDTLNEPSQGYIGYPDLNMVGGKTAAYGAIPTLYQGMVLSAGYPQTVQYKPSQLLPGTKPVRLNANGVSIWKPGFEEVWKRVGVWDTDAHGKPHLLKPDYFGVVNGKPVNFDQEYLAPFMEKYAREIRTVDADAIIFLSPPPAEMRAGPPGFSLSDPRGVAFAPHWYDGLTLTSHAYLPWVGVDTGEVPPQFAFGHLNRRKAFAHIIGKFVTRAKTELGEAPIVIGETGIPFNMHGQKAYRDGNFSKQAQALDDTIQAMEANFVNFTLWNYTADNNNLHGDQWNAEDLSIFSRDQQKGTGDHYDGGRALEAVIRPYAARTPGQPLSSTFDLRSRTFRYTFQLDPTIHAPLVIFLPSYHYPPEISIKVTKGQVIRYADEQRLEYFPDPAERVHTIQITVSK